ncbi:unnamed protein product [Brachionus calyciflorus]|uniref:Uncharacterized protein n=1 Tax=Brachionus calyciflorus TaxID=104777 RepID=A0A814HJH3_9BILA|nr:unnamed protein product [Brachionus calyciflorus]
MVDFDGDDEDVELQDFLERVTEPPELIVETIESPESNNIQPRERVRGRGSRHGREVDIVHNDFLFNLHALKHI